MRRVGMGSPWTTVYVVSSRAFAVPDCSQHSDGTPQCGAARRLPLDGMTRQQDIDAIRAAARPLRRLDDVEAILDAIGDARLVLLGEASHGTREFYRLRGELTRRLIEERGFDAVAVEADWPSALRA